EQHQRVPAAGWPLVVQVEGGGQPPRPPGRKQAPRGPGPLVTQGRQQPPQGDQAAVVVGQRLPGGGPGAGPVQLVEGGGGVKAVLQPLLGAAELFPCQHEPVPLAGEAEGHRQPVGLQDDGGGLVEAAGGVHGDDQLVPQGPVVVAGRVVDGLGGGPGGEPPSLGPRPAGDGHAQAGQPGRPAVDKAGALGVEDVALDQVPGGVAEGAGVLVQGGQGPLAGGLGPPVHGAAVGAPGLAEEDLFPFAVFAVQGGADAL